MESVHSAIVDSGGYVSAGPTVATKGLDGALRVKPDQSAVYLWHGSRHLSITAEPFYALPDGPRRRNTVRR